MLVHERWCRRANHQVKMVRPRMPPWLAMPPSQTRKNHEGIVEPAGPVVEDHAAEAAAEEDAEEGGPGDEIADFFRRQLGVAALREPVVNEVAGEEGEDVGEAVPPGPKPGVISQMKGLRVCR
jgi:hypothetical protein